MKATNHDSFKLECRQIKSEMTYELRKKVLWPHIKNDDYSLVSDTANETFHLGVYLKKKIISIGTFVKEQNDKIKELHKQVSELEGQVKSQGSKLMASKLGKEDLCKKVADLE